MERALSIGGSQSARKSPHAGPPHWTIGRSGSRSSPNVLQPPALRREWEGVRRGETARAFKLVSRRRAHFLHPRPQPAHEGGTRMQPLDCIVIGYNDVPFSQLADKHKPLEWYSGKYSALKSNSVLVGGERKNYMELLNHTITQTHGSDPRFNAFELPNLGAIYLTSYLRRRGFGVELVNFFNYGRGRLRALLPEGPRAVAITTTYYVEDEPVREMVDFIREHCPDTRIIVGGP